MKHWSIILLVTISVSIIGCDMLQRLFDNGHNNSIKNDFELNDPFTIQYSDTLYNYDENIWISFDSLVADSRCPIGVVCKWEGNAELSFVFNKTEVSHCFSLNTHAGFVRDTSLAGYGITMRSVKPYPHIDSTYTADDYSAELIIQK